MNSGEGYARAAGDSARSARRQILGPVRAAFSQRLEEDGGQERRGKVTVPPLRSLREAARLRSLASVEAGPEAAPAPVRCLPAISFNTGTALPRSPATAYGCAQARAHGGVREAELILLAVQNCLRSGLQMWGEMDEEPRPKDERYRCDERL